MIPILMYHQIDVPAPRGTPYRGLTVHPRDFRRQMHWLRRLGFQGLSMAALMPYLRGEKQGRVIGITFDDGYQNVLDHAMPVLDDCGFQATSYVVAQRLGEANVWDRDEGVPEAPLMDLDGVQQWLQSGHEIGSHTLTHPVLTRLSASDASREIGESRQTLEAMTGGAVRAFCYPYGKWTPALAAQVRSAGYDTATTTARGLVRPSDDFFGLPRVAVSRSTHQLRFLQKCLTSLEDRKRRQQAVAESAGGRVDAP